MSAATNPVKRPARSGAWCVALHPLVAVWALAAAALAYSGAQAHRSDTETNAELAFDRSVSLIATQVRRAVEGGDLTLARQIVLDAQGVSGFQSVQVELNGRDYFDSLQTDASGPSGSVSEVAESRSFEPGSRVYTFVEPLGLASEPGVALRAVSIPVARPSGALLWNLAIGAGLGACFGTLALWLLIKRQGFAALLAIRSAIRAYMLGERATPALVVHGRFGEVAKGFNAILKERDELSETIQGTKAHTHEHKIADAPGVLVNAWDAIPHGLVIIDPTLRLVSINGAGSAYLGVESEGTKGNSICDLEAFGQVIPLVESSFQPDAPRRVVGEIKPEGSDTVLRVGVARVRAGTDTYAVALLEDVTQQRMSDEMLNAFIAQATHELRTPLTNIRLYAEEAVDSGADDEEFRSNAFNMINDESRRLERIISDMLSVSELEAGSMTLRLSPVRPEKIFDEIRRDYTAQANAKEISFHLDLPPKFPIMNADHDRLTQAIHNLVGNAIKYTPGGGAVTVGVGFDGAGTMTVKVTDTGIGISQEDQSVIFERFCRASDKRVESIVGTGLGLSISREIARLHDGDLTVESQLDHGSTFTLTIPGAEEQLSAAA